MCCDWLLLELLFRKHIIDESFEKKKEKKSNQVGLAWFQTDKIDSIERHSKLPHSLIIISWDTINEPIHAKNLYIDARRSEIITDFQRAVLFVFLFACKSWLSECLRV